MKSIKNINALAIVIFVMFAVFVSGCKEVGPQIDLTNGRHALQDTTYVESPVQTPETKNVLVEMLTGVSCDNCPNGHAIVDNLKASYPGRIVEVAMHTNTASSQDASLPDTKQVLSCNDALTLLNYFFEPGFRPAGSIDRIVHNNIAGSNSIYDDRSNWGGYTATQMALTTPVNIVLTSSLTGSTLTVAVELHYTLAQTDSERVSIFLTEDSIITSQLLSDGSDDSTYVHMAILRAAVTNALGNNISGPIAAGTVVRKVYPYPITNPLWKPEHMHVVAFVHKYQNGTSDVLQSKVISAK